MVVRIAAVQALSYYGDQEYRNVDLAVRYIDEAAKGGADLIILPEGYPGPNNGPLDSGGRLTQRPIDVMREKARDHKIFLSCGELEANPDMRDTFYLTQKLVSPGGEILSRYARVQPDHMYLNAYLMGGRKHILPGDNRKGLDPLKDVRGVVGTPLGTIGIQICSEIFVPELSRIQMLMGAQIILAPMNGWPGGGSKYRCKETWHCIARARAAENLVFVVIPDIIYERPELSYGPNDQEGFGIVASPEKVLAQRTDPGPMCVELDLDRLKWLRNRYFDDDNLAPPEHPDFVPIGCRPGENHDRRPEFYRPLIEPQPDAFNYFYFRNGLNEFVREFEKVKKAT
jgi:predicted amidohydrolase